MKRGPNHGLRKTGAYESWAHMIQRCTNPNNKDFARYGGAGVLVCGRWLKFKNFYADMGERPEGFTLDRIDGANGYQPNNCRWASRQEQSANSGQPRIIEYGGKAQNISAWAREVGLKEDTLHMRLYRGWPIEKALTWRKP